MPSSVASTLLLSALALAAAGASVLAIAILCTLAAVWEIGVFVATALSPDV